MKGTDKRVRRKEAAPQTYFPYEIRHLCLTYLLLITILLSSDVTVDNAMSADLWVRFVTRMQ